MKSKAAPDDDATLLKLRASFEKDYQEQQKLPPNKRVKPLEQDKLTDPIGMDTPDAKPQGKRADSMRLDSMRLDSGLAKILAVQTQFNALYAAPPTPESKPELIKVKRQLATLYARSDTWSPRTISLRLDTIALRLDKIGKQCGNGWISPDKECQLNSGQSAPEAKPEAKASNSGGSLAKALITGAAILGVSAAAYTAARANYRAGIPKSAEMAKGMAKDIEVPDVPEGKKAITFTVGGFYGFDGDASARKGEDYFQYKMASEVLGSKDDPGGDHFVVQHRNTEFNVTPSPVGGVARHVRDQVEHYRRVMEPVFTQGRNPQAVKLAAEAYAYSQKYPDKEIQLVGHSAGGMVTHETAEILHQMGVKTTTVNLGSGWFGFTETPPGSKSHTIAAKSDLYLQTLIGSTRDTVSIGSDNAPATMEAHLVRHYMNDLESRAKINELLTPEASKSKKPVAVKADSVQRRRDRAQTGKPGKQCGNSHIPADKECHAGNSAGQPAQAASPQSTGATSPFDFNHLATIAGVAIASRIAAKASGAVNNVVDKGLEAAFQDVVGTLDKLASKFKGDPEKKQQVAKVKEKVESLSANPPDDMDEKQLEQLRQQLERLYNRSDSISDGVIALRLDAIAVRLDKACGESFIAEKKECRIGQPGDNTGSTNESAQVEKTNTLRKGGNGWRNAAIAGATLLGVSAVSYLAMRQHYRSGFKESAVMAKTVGEKLVKQPYVVSDHEHELAGEMGITLPKNTALVPDVLYGHTLTMREALKQKYNVDETRLPIAKQITLVANGFDGHENADGAAAVASDFAGKEFADHHIVPISNAGFSAKSRSGGIFVSPEDAIKTQLDVALTKGRNPVAVNLAATAYAFHQKHPDLPVNLIGYSGAGMATHEAAEILQQMNISVKVANFGSPYWGLTQKVGESVTFNAPGDYVTQKTPVRDEINVNEVKDHFSYLKSDAVRSKLKDFLDGKPIVGEAVRKLTEADRAKAAKRQKAMERAAKMQQARAAKAAKADSIRDDQACEAQPTAYYVAAIETALQTAYRSDSQQPDAVAAARALVRNAIATVFSGIASVLTVSQNAGNLTGVFRDRSSKLYQFTINTSGDGIRYQQIQKPQRVDASRFDEDSDQCKKGTPCGLSCVPAGSHCETELSASAQALVKLAHKTLETEQIPSRAEIVQVAGLLAGEAIRNPIKFIREGSQREAAVRQALKQRGVDAPTRIQTAKIGVSRGAAAIKTYMADNPEAVKELAVAATGFVGSTVGGAVAGPVGGIAGEVGTVLVSRKVISDYQALQSARKKLKHDEAFQAAGRLQKLKMLQKVSIEELKAIDMNEGRAGDLAGAIMGGSAGSIAGAAIGGLAGPIAGITTGISSAITAQKTYAKVKEGKALGAALQESAQEVATAPGKAIAAGNEREQRTRRKAKPKIRQGKIVAKIAGLY